MGIACAGIVSVLMAVQQSGASIAGTVLDAESGTPLSEAVVSLVDLDRSVLTDAAGTYVFRGVPPGPQHVSVRRVGYAPRTFEALAPSRGTLEINVALRPVPITLPTISVRGAVAIRSLDDAHGDTDSTGFPDRGLSLAAVRNHPLLSEPDVLRAVGGGQVVLDPEAPSGVHIRGGGSDQVAYLLDGIPVFSPYHAAGTFAAWNPDALARLDVVTSAASLAFPDALSGTVSASTRTPGRQLLAQGGFSSTQARVTIDGPMGGNAGYLLSLRTTFPGLLAHRREPTYLRGEGGDRLGTIQAPVLGGRLRLLAYESDNEIAAAVSDTAGAEAIGSPRHALSWASSSFGGGWTRRVGRTSVEVRAWRAAADAGAIWSAPDSERELLTATRRDAGLAAMVERFGGRTHTTAGIRAQWSRTAYRLRPDSTQGPTAALGARTPSVAGLVRHQRPLTARGDLALSLVGTRAAGRLHLDPDAQLRWSASGALSLTGSYARRHQFAQSVRNPESAVAAIFPADLYVGAGGTGVPVARSDLGILALDYRPVPGMRFGAQAYARAFDALALVAPRGAEPFATSGFTRGSGTARGVALEAAAGGARYGLVVSYGLQHVRLQYGDTSYAPEFTAPHTIDAGVIVFPSPSASLRLGITGAMGRRTTAVEGPLEWEDCNLLDMGCEFAGSPSRRVEPLGATRLPAYVRVDVGIRKHWHVAIGGRDGVVAVFGTATNLLNRRNVLTVAVDPATGARRSVVMRPRSPLVVGLDWRF